MSCLRYDVQPSSVVVKAFVEPIEQSTQLLFWISDQRVHLDVIFPLIFWIFLGVSLPAVMGRLMAQLSRDSMYFVFTSYFMSDLNDWIGRPPSRSSLGIC